MLIEPRLHPPNAMLRTLGTSDPALVKLSDGLYQINHFSFDMLLSSHGGNLQDEDDWDGYTEDLPGAVPCYGVCDSPTQFIERFGAALQEDAGRYCVAFTRVAKAAQPAEGGWRWHKWGPYVGVHEPTYEHLHDEPTITEVYTFHVFRRRDCIHCGKPKRDHSPRLDWCCPWALVFDQTTPAIQQLAAAAGLKSDADFPSLLRRVRALAAEEKRNHATCRQ